MLKIKYILLGLCFATSTLSGCSMKNVPVTVTSFNNPYTSTKTYKKFVFAQLDGLSQPPDQHLRDAAKKALEERGYTFNADAPEFIVSIQSSNEPINGQKNTDKPVPPVDSKKIKIVFGDPHYNKLIWQGEGTAVYEADKINLEKCILLGLLQNYPEKRNSVLTIVKPDLCKKNIP